MPSRTSLTTFLLAGAFAALAALPAGLADPPAEDLFKDRASFIPQRKHEPLKGTAVGILLYDGQPVLSTEGRSGPADQLCFARGNTSYRWVYVPTQGQAQITNLRVPVGDKGEFQTYAALDMARPKSVTPWGITTKFTLVQVEVNNGAGSPMNDSFVATSIKNLEGTSDYPLKVEKVVAELKERYQTFVKEKAKEIESALGEAKKKSLKDRPATGPREQAQLMYLTWMPESKTLRANFRTTISDGAYTTVQQGGPIRKFPLPPQPGGKGPFLPQAFNAFPPPPPPDGFRTVKVGTTFGIEFGMAYEVSREGTLLRSQMLPFESFQRELRMPVGRPLPGPLPLPPARGPKLGAI
jgi:hypothetical protein